MDEDGVLCGLVQLIPVVHVLATTYLRGKVREKNYIGGWGIWDFLASCCCHPCALVQQGIEVDALDDGAIMYINSRS